LENNLSDSNIADNTDGNALYEQYLHDVSSGNIDFQPFMEEKHDADPLKTAEISVNNKEAVAAKVKGATISQSTIESTSTNEGNNGSIINEGSSNDRNNGNRSTTMASDIALDTSSTDPVEDLVREWESKNKELSATFREIARQTAIINITRGRGITVSDLVDNEIGLDNAEKLLPQAVNIGLLIRLENRLGKQHQYCLSNYVHILNSKDDKEKEILPSDVSLLLARELSGMKYVYHNIHLVTTLNYKDDYNVLNWNVPSEGNKQKMQSFTLEPRRSVNFRISSRGTVNISIQCTYHPFEFHTATGLMNFFGTCGKIDTYLQLCTKNRINVVPWFGNWSLMQFDYNKDLSTKDLKDKYHSKVISWSSKGVLKVYYLGVIFRIYCKMMPYIGECLRAEGRFSTKEKVKIADSMSRISAVCGTGADTFNDADNAEDNKKHPFTTIEEMLLNKRRSERDDVALSKNKGKEEEL